MNTPFHQLLIEYQPSTYQGLYVLVREESNYLDEESKANSIALQRGCIIEEIKPFELSE